MISSNVGRRQAPAKHRHACPYAYTDLAAGAKSPPPPHPAVLMLLSPRIGPPITGPIRGIVTAVSPAWVHGVFDVSRHHTAEGVEGVVSSFRTLRTGVLRHRGRSGQAVSPGSGTACLTR